MAVAVATAVGVAVVMEEKKAEDIGSQARAADSEDELRGTDFLGLKETLDSLEENGETEGEEEDAVDQGSEDFGALPL